MDNVGKGFIAGLIATTVLPALILLKSTMGMLPALDAIKMQTQMLNKFIGTPAVPAVGWISHFVIGTNLWGCQGIAYSR